MCFCFCIVVNYFLLFFGEAFPEVAGECESFEVFDLLDCLCGFFVCCVCGEECVLVGYGIDCFE